MRLPFCVLRQKGSKKRALTPPAGVLSEKSKWNSLRTFAFVFRNFELLLLISVAQKQEIVGTLARKSGSPASRLPTVRRRIKGSVGACLQANERVGVLGKTLREQARCYSLDADLGFAFSFDLYVHEPGSRREVQDLPDACDDHQPKLFERSEFFGPRPMVTTIVSTARHPIAFCWDGGPSGGIVYCFK